MGQHRGTGVTEGRGGWEGNLPYPPSFIPIPHPSSTFILSSGFFSKDSEFLSVLFLYSFWILFLASKPSTFCSLALFSSSSTPSSAIHLSHPFSPLGNPTPVCPKLADLVSLAQCFFDPSRLQTRQCCLFAWFLFSTTSRLCRDHFYYNDCYVYVRVCLLTTFFARTLWAGWCSHTFHSFHSRGVWRGGEWK